MKKTVSSLLISVVSLLDITLINTINADATQLQTFNNKSDNFLEANSNQKKLLLANGSNGLCDGTFTHPVGNVTFSRGIGDPKLNFGFRLSPSSRLLLGDVVSGFMIESSVQYWKINPPYAPHKNLPSSYDFHGSIYKYARRGSSGSFELQAGDKIKFTWIVTGTGAKSRAVVVRAVECKYF